MKKKGISPLIATVLILGFTVALAAVIMTWGMDFVETMQKGTEETSNVKVMCATEVDFDIIGVCNTTLTEYKTTIANNGAIDITQFTIRYYVTEADVKAVTETFVTTPPAGIAAFGLESEDVKLTGLVDGITLVEAIAWIKVGEESLACSDNIDSYGKLGDAIASC